MNSKQITLVEFQRACDEHRTLEPGTQIVFSVPEFEQYERAYRRTILECVQDLLIKRLALIGKPQKQVKGTERN